LSDAKESALERLSEDAAREFPHLLAARAETAKGLQDRRSQLAKLPHDDDASVVLMGSWGRSEVTSGSDDDFMVLVDGQDRDHVQPSIAEVKTVLTHAPATRA
jgi:UTP:GlnB (protein PII) uridylyltransferase